MSRRCGEPRDVQATARLLSTVPVSLIPVGPVLQGWGNTTTRRHAGSIEMDDGAVPTVWLSLEIERQVVARPTASPLSRPHRQKATAAPSLAGS